MICFEIGCLDLVSGLMGLTLVGMVCMLTYCADEARKSILGVLGIFLTLPLLYLSVVSQLGAASRGVNIWEAPEAGFTFLAIALTLTDGITIAALVAHLPFVRARLPVHWLEV